MIPRLPRVHAAGHMAQSVYHAEILRYAPERVPYGPACSHTGLPAQSLRILTSLIYGRISALGVVTATSSNGSWRIVWTPLDQMT